MTMEDFKKITDQGILADIAENGEDILIRKAAAEKLTDQEFRQKMFARIDQDMTDSRMRKAAAKRLSSQQASVSAVKKISDYDTRIKECKKIGGHFFEKNALNKCKCAVCGYQHHKGHPNNGFDWHCARCGGLIHTFPFVEGMPRSIITFSDGTNDYVRGYDGVIYGDIETEYPSD